MSKVIRATEAALDNRARQIALTAAIGFATFVMFTQFVHAFLG